MRPSSTVSQKWFRIFLPLMCNVFAFPSVHAAESTQYTAPEIVRDPAPLADDRFGAALAIDGDTLIVLRADGNPADGVERDGVMAYRRGPDGWHFESELRSVDKLPISLRAASVAASGPFAVIGAPAAGNLEEGRAFLWERAATGQWRQVRVLKSSQPNRYANFGHAVDIDDNTLVVGSPSEVGPKGLDNGAAHVFQRGSKGWRHARTLLPPASKTRLDRFGDGVSIDNSRILVGAPLTSGLDSVPAVGAAVVFARNQGGPGRWGVAQEIRSPDSEDSAQCGRSVAIDGHRAALGCPNSREVWVHRIGSAGSPVRLRDPVDEHFFGSAIDLRGERLVVNGAGLRTDLESEVFVYRCPDVSPLSCTVETVLTEGADRHGYGRTVAVDENGTVAVGYDDEGADYLSGGAVFVHHAR